MFYTALFYTNNNNPKEEAEEGICIFAIEMVLIKCYEKESVNHSLFYFVLYNPINNTYRRKTNRAIVFAIHHNKEAI